MRALLKLLLAPLLLLLGVEALFRAGAWEPFARPDSHAGTSILRKRALSSPAYRRIDYVTLGSSRPEYGLDHEALAALAQRHGRVHANLSMPGSHWMTLDVLGDWLARAHPEVRGGIIALSIQDFLFAGNGAYELGIVYPFHRLADVRGMAQHVPFTREDPATWGLISALFEYREDVRDALLHPRERRDSLAWWHARPAEELLRQNTHRDEDMCAFGLDALDACDKVEVAGGERAAGLARQCRELRSGAKGRFDLTAMTRQQPQPEFLQLTRDLVRARLRSLRWSTPPIVVLMPAPRVWQDAVSPSGLHDWALDVLRPLTEDGSIHLIDATTALETDGRTDCRLFFDFYHQNDAGRARLMETLLPQIAALLYDARAAPAPP